MDVYQALLPSTADLRAHPEKYTRLRRDYPDLIARTRRVGAAKNHAALLAQGGAKFIRLYNLSETTPQDLQRVDRLLHWMFDEFGIRFIAGMYDPPSNAAAQRVARGLSRNPRMLAS